MFLSVLETTWLTKDANFESPTLGWPYVISETIKFGSIDLA
jgi:hypothetical protein